MKFKFLTITTLLISINSYGAESSSTTRSIGFEECKKVINLTIDKVGANALTIADTAILYMKKVYTSDSEILLTCSKPDGKMTTTVTPK